MVRLASIAVHEGAERRSMGLRRALVTRRANLGDCADARSVLRRLLSPGALRRPSVVVPLSRPQRGESGAGDLAMAVSRRSLAGGIDARAVGALIYCHATPDEHTAESSAGRLQHGLGLARAHPFSVSQAHNSALFAALDIAVGLVAGPEDAGSVLLVAADKMVFGPPPNDPSRMDWADVAGAALVTREPLEGWLVGPVLLRQHDTACTAHGPWPEAERRALASAAAAMLIDAVNAAGLPAGAVRASCGTRNDPGFASLVHRLAGVQGAAPGAPRARRAEGSATADTLLALARLEPLVRPGEPVLAWCHGNNGELACALLTRSAAS